MFESFAAFTKPPYSQGKFDSKSVLKNEDVEADCFYNVLLRIDTNKLHKYYGYMYMEDSRWLENYASSLQYEEHMAGATESLSLSFTVPHPNTSFYGLPERSSLFALDDTEDQDPYRLYSVDLFPHEEWNKQGLYSGIPYLLGH